MNLNLNNEPLTRRDVFALVITEMVMRRSEMLPGLSYNKMADIVQSSTDALLYRLEHLKPMPCPCKERAKAEAAKEGSLKDPEG